MIKFLYESTEERRALLHKPKFGEGAISKKFELCNKANPSHPPSICATRPFKIGLYKLTSKARRNRITEAFATWDDVASRPYCA